MRYLVIKESEHVVHIWSKNQHRIEQKHNMTRECSHRDYLRQKAIPFANVSSIGMVYYNPQNGTVESSVCSWDTPAPEGDTDLVKKQMKAFYKAHPELKEDIQADWDAYEAWKQRAKELMAARGLK
ncbi:MAG: hypothetical protein ACI4OR_02605 [Alphaproteobacteria bacterium]